ncbi:MAG: hypothetical protein WC390_07105 [Sulfurimonas sp.]|jgi:hypothetical protein
MEKEKKNKYFREYYQKHKEQYKKYQKGDRYCKEKRKEYNKKYQYFNKNKLKNKKRIYYLKNKDKLNTKNKNNYNKNKDNYKKTWKLYYNKNKDNLINKAKKWAKENKTKRKLYLSKYYHNNKTTYKINANKYNKKRKNIDINYKITCYLRNRIWWALKGNIKSKRTIELLGCSIDFLKQHLENKFTTGMTWLNYGRNGWEIDHILPCSKFDLSDPEQQKQCFHFSNLQPLWAKENKGKYNKIFKNQLKILI